MGNGHGQSDCNQQGGDGGSVGFHTASGDGVDKREGRIQPVRAVSETVCLEL